MANVLFKRGLHANLPTSNSIVDGTFYLTTDTHRLYVGNEYTDTLTNEQVKELVELNKSITTVSQISDLPQEDVEVGQFYYVAGTNLHNGEQNSNGNILAVVTSVANGVPTWTQVNPDTDTQDHLGSVTVTKGNLANHLIPYTFTYYIVDKNNAAIRNFTSTLNIAPADIISLTDVAVTTGATDTANNSVTVTTQVKNTDNNALSTGDSFTIKGGTNVTVSNNNGDIVISSGIGTDSVKFKTVADTDSTTGEKTVTAKVQVNTVDSGDILILKGEKDIAVDYTTSTNNGVTTTTAKLGHSNTATAAATGSAITLSNSSPSFTAVTSETYDTYGHVTAQTSQTITLPSYSIKTVDVDSTDKSKLKISLTDQNNVEFGAVTSGSILYHTITVYDSPSASATAVTKKNQDDLGTFYSKAAIDSMMKSLDALTYKGTVASSNDLPTAADGIAVGDTYKVSSANSGITVGGQTAKLGDLLIATGTEDTDGNITSATLEWTLVSSGSDSDTQYDFKVKNGSNNVQVGILANTANNNFTQYATVSGDGVVTVTGTEGVNGNGALAFAHANSGATAGSYGANTAGAIAAGGNIIVPSLTVDAKGHVTAVSDVTLSIPGAPKLAGDATNKQVKLLNSNNVDLGTITFADGTLTTAAVTANNENETVIISHAVPTGYASATTSTSGLDLTSATSTDRAIEVPSITRDSYGHVTAVDVKTVTIGQIDYNLGQTIASTTAGNSSIDSVTVTTNLTNQNNVNKGSSAFTLLSENKTIEITNPVDGSNNATNNINIDIVWGTF